MTLPPIIRIFFAIDLPPETKESIGKFVSQLKKLSKSQGIRWTKPENLHITLQFLAEMKSEHLKQLIANARSNIVNTIKKSSFKIGKFYLLPSPYRPRVIVLEISPQETLEKLAYMLGNGIEALGYETEKRPFRAHLTLGRIKQPHGFNVNFLAECPTPAMDEIPVEEVVLFHSEPQPEGSVYHVLERISLAD